MFIGILDIFGFENFVIINVISVKSVVYHQVTNSIEQYKLQFDKFLRNVTFLGSVSTSLTKKFKSVIWFYIYKVL